VALNRKTSRSLQRQIDLSTAVCQERLLATHVRHVLALVDLVSDEIAFDSAVDIYARILRLNPEQARNVGSRALAALGQRTGLPEAELLERSEAEAAANRREIEEAEGQVETEDAGDAGGGRFGAVFSRVRKRVRGRVQEDLRSRINLAAARAEDALFEAHVENALIFGKALRDEVPLHEAVDLYLEVMTVPDGVSDVIFNRALRSVADDVLPPLDGGPAVRADGAAAGAAAR
jgi:hypothetical protein